MDEIIIQVQPQISANISAQEALASKIAAQTAQSAAETAQSAAETAQGAAETSENNAANSAISADNAKDTSIAAAGYASQAQGLSETARDASIAAKVSSEAARDASIAAKVSSEAARDASIAAKNDSQNLLGVVGLGTPKATYATLAALQSAAPDHAYIYVVVSDGKWYYWSGSAWAAGGTYQAAMSVVQVLGDSTTAVASQKAITDAAFVTGKNKFNKSDSSIIAGFYLDGSGNQQADQYSYISHYIPITAGQTLFCSSAWGAGSGVFHELTDVNKANKVMMWIQESNVNRVTATVTGYVRFSLRMYPVGTYTLANTQVEIGTVGTTYEAFAYTINKAKITELNDSAVPATIARGADIAAAYAALVTNKNKFNNADSTNITGKYFDQNGVQQSDASSMITHYIPIAAGQTMHCSSMWDASNGVYCELSDSNKTNKTYVATASNQNITASVAGYVRFSLRFFLANTLNNTQVEIGTVSTTYEAYALTISASIVPSTIQRTSSSTTKTCKRFGTAGVDCDYSGLNAIQTCLNAITAASATNQYTIIADGHFIFTLPADVAGVDPAMSSEFAAVVGKDYVNIEGLGTDRTMIAVEFESNTVFPSGKTYQDYQPIAWNCNSTLKNISVIARNCRYCLHFEGGSYVTGKTLNIENCYFHHKGNSAMGENYANGLGTGMRDGQIWNFRNCEFICDSTGSFACHTALDAVTRGGDINFYDCTFEGGNIILDVYPVERQIRLNLINPKFRKAANITLRAFVTGLSVSANYAHFAIKASCLPICFDNQLANGLGLRIRSKSTGTGSTVRYYSLCTAFALIGDATKTVADRTPWQSILISGYEYRDGGVGLRGYAVGWNDVDSATSHRSLGKILGDCSSVNKTLTVTIDGTVYNVVFNDNCTNKTNAQVIATIVAVVGTVADVDTFAVGSNYYPDFSGLRIMENIDTTAILAGMGVIALQKTSDSSWNPNSVRRALNSDARVDFIALDSIAVGQKGRFIPRGSELFNAYYNTRFQALQINANAGWAEFGISATQPGYWDENATPKLMKSLNYYTLKLL